jgi:mycoredoxin-dependent peroxiredoxin
MVAVGDAAPDFELLDQDRRPVRLSALRGSPVVLVFYPFSFTPVCATELATLRDERAVFDDLGATILAVSCDTYAVHRAWAERQNFGFRLLADFWPHGEVAQAYGVFDDERGCAGRGTFVIDREGRVRWTVTRPIPEARDHLEYLKALEEL